MKRSRMSVYAPILLLALAGQAAVAIAQGVAGEPVTAVAAAPPVAPLTDAATLLPNGRAPLSGVLVGGQPTAEALAPLAAAGYEVLVNLRTAEEGAPPIAEEAQRLGLRYVELPVAGPQDLGADKVAALGKLLAGRADAPVVVYCASGNRAAALLALEQAQVEGKSAQEALEVGLAAGLTRLEPVVRERLGLPPA